MALLDDLLAQIATSANTQRNAQQTYGTNMDVKLQDIYNALQGELQAGQNAQQQFGQQQQADLSSIFDRSNQNIQGTTDDIAKQMTDEAGRLGISAGVGDPLNKLRTSLGNIKGYTEATKANQLAGASARNSNILTSGQMGIDSSRKNLASQRTDLLQNVQNALAKIGTGQSSQEQDIRNQFAQAQSDLESKLATQQQQQDFQTQLALMKEEGANSRSSASIASKGELTPYQMAQLGLSQDRLDLQKKSANKPKKGHAGVDQVLSPKKFPVANGYIKAAIADAAKRANPKSLKKGEKKQDPYTIALGIINASKDKKSKYYAPNLDPNALKIALDAYYGKR